MKRPNFTRLREYQQQFAQVRSQMQLKNKKDLALLRHELRVAIVGVSVWLRLDKQGKRKLPPES